LNSEFRPANAKQLVLSEEALAKIQEVNTRKKINLEKTKKKKKKTPLGKTGFCRPFGRVIRTGH